MKIFNWFRKKNNNSITSILVYKIKFNEKYVVNPKYEDIFAGYTWVFDDASVGLNKEAFVSGADTLLDKISQGKDQVLINFSSSEFPGYKLKLDYTSGKAKEGTYYRCEQLQQDLWLCPALNKYFSKSPKQIYLDYKI